MAEGMPAIDKYSGVGFERGVRIWFLARRAIHIQIILFVLLT